MPGCPHCPQLLHPLHGGTVWAVPTCVIEGGAGGPWAVNKGLFSPLWDTEAGEAAGQVGVGRKTMNVGIHSDTPWLFDPERGQLSQGRGGARGWEWVSWFGK